MQIRDKTFVPLLDADTVQHRVHQLAEQLNLDYAGKQPMLVVVLNGAFLFAADLMKHLTIPCEITFIRVASYTATQSTGHIRPVLGLQNEALQNRNLIVVEDIVDTGLTIRHVCEQLQQYQPASIAVATLLFKPDALQTGQCPDYVGFAIENQFVLGYGLDYDGLGRNSAGIFVVE